MNDTGSISLIEALLVELSGGLFIGLIINIGKDREPILREAKMALCVGAVFMFVLNVIVMPLVTFIPSDTCFVFFTLNFGFIMLITIYTPKRKKTSTDNNNLFIS